MDARNPRTGGTAAPGGDEVLYSPVGNAARPGESWWSCRRRTAGPTVGQAETQQFKGGGEHAELVSPAPGRLNVARSGLRTRGEAGALRGGRELDPVVVAGREDLEVVGHRAAVSSRSPAALRSARKAATACSEHVEAVAIRVGACVGAPEEDAGWLVGVHGEDGQVVGPAGCPQRCCSVSQACDSMRASDNPLGEVGRVLAAGLHSASPRSMV